MRAAASRCRSVIVAVTATACLVIPSAASWASCAVDDRSMAEQVADATVVFVGTTTEVTNRQRTATFDVHELWKRPDDAPPIGSEVTVYGGPDEPNTATSVDRAWQTGQRYLVVPTVQGDRYEDNACSPTVEWTSDIADVRPPDAIEVGAGGDDRFVTELPIPWIVAGVSVLVLSVAAAYVASRRH